jgi:outer membrane protein TolC
VGNASEFELLRAQVARDNQRPQVIQAHAQRDQAYLRLKQLLDLPLEQEVRLTTDIEDSVPVPGLVLTSAGAAAAGDTSVAPAVAAADTSVDHRAPVRQARASVDAQEHLLRSARGQRLPSLQLSSQYNRIGYPSGNVPPFSEFFPNWTVTVGASIPLFTGGRIRGDEMVARANLLEAKERYQQTRELAALDTRLAIDQLAQAQAAWQASAGTADQAARAYRIAEVRYREGISTQLELTQSRVQLHQAEATRATAARDLAVARMRLALLRDLPLAAGAAAGATGTSRSQGGTTSSQQQQQQQQAPQQGAPQGQGAGAFTQTSSTGGTTP